MTKPPTQVKVVLLGDSGVGKSCIVMRFVADSFKMDPEATIGASYMGKNMQFNDKMIKFNIWDTAGQERYHSLAKMYYRDANAALMIYDITKKSSFEGLRRWHKELQEFGPKDIAVVIVGNKEDLVESETVSQDEAIAFANSIGALYKKASAKTSYGIEQIFKDLAIKLYPELDTIVTPSTRSGSVFVGKDYNASKAKEKKKCC